MEINRNQYFMFGIILLLFGMQLRVVDSYVLSEETSRFIAEQTGKTNTAAASMLAITSPSASQRVVRPPRWAGWCLTSIGAVFILHALVLKGPGG